MPGLAIEIQGVSKRFGTVQSLDGLELSVAKGSVFGFLGLNGAGKTTTLRVLLGLVRPDSGTLAVLGLDPRTHGTEVRNRVGVLLEQDGLYGRLSASYNLEYHARIHHLAANDRSKRIEELLRSVDLWDRREESVITWSKGMRQKLAIARALLHRPELVLLDEPFSGLDPVAATELRTSIMALAKGDGVTVVLTTHDLAHVEKACDQVVVMNKGRVIASGAPSTIGGSTDQVRAEAKGGGLTPEILQGMQRDGQVSSFDLKEGVAVIVCPRSRRPALATELVKRGVELEELRTVGNSLEEAFLTLMATEKAS